MFKHVSLIAVLALSFSSNMVFSATNAAKKAEPVAANVAPVANKHTAEQIMQGVCAACHDLSVKLKA